jgi:hypothetical protein
VSVAGDVLVEDAEGPLVGLQTPPARRDVTPLTRSFIAVILDPGLEGAPSHGRMVHRLENWMGTLTRARLSQAEEIR